VNFSVATFSCAFFRPWSTIDAFYRSQPAELGWKIESPSQRGATIGARAGVWRMSQTR
jgi:hypothetical protein